MATLPHRILDFAAQRNEALSRPLLQAAELECTVHSLLGWEWQKNMSIPQTIAADHLLIHVQSGTLEAQINGQEWRASKQQCLWIPKHARRGLRAKSHSIFIAAHLDLHGAQPQQVQILKSVSNCSSDAFNDLQQLIAQLSHQQSELLRLATPFYQHLFHQLLLNGDIDCQQQVMQDELISSAMAALAKDPSLSVEACARYSGLGVTRFRQRFTSASGMSPGAYITHIRIEKATYLLRETKQSVAEISIACGYENPNYLYRVFKDRHHCTPTEYRDGMRHSV